MRPFRERSPLPIGIVGVVAILLALLLAFDIGNLPFINSGHTVYAEFNDAANLQKGATVRVSGVLVGKVTSVKLEYVPGEGNLVKVGMRVSGGPHIGADTTANLKIETRNGDYFKILKSLKNGGGRRKILLFLGSNIGNFGRDQSIDFFRQLRAVMNPNDLLFIGFDLQKDPHVILKAYDDPQGITAAFNLNLLRRINRELGGDFDLDKFVHYALYRPVECAARSFLISREQQTAHIEALGRSFSFEPWEAIFMEISQKYSLPMIEALAAESGFAVKQNFFDSKYYYCDSLWQLSA